MSMPAQPDRSPLRRLLQVDSTGRAVPTSSTTANSPGIGINGTEVRPWQIAGVDARTVGGKYHGPIVDGGGAPFDFTVQLTDLPAPFQLAKSDRARIVVIAVPRVFTAGSVVQQLLVFPGAKTASIGYLDTPNLPGGNTYIGYSVRLNGYVIASQAVLAGDYDVLVDLQTMLLVRPG